VTEASTSPQSSRSSVGINATTLLFAATLILLVFAYRELGAWSPGGTTNEDAPTLFVPSHTSPLYVASLSALFLYIRINRLRFALRRPEPAAVGWWLLLPGVGIAGWSHYTSAPDILLLSLIPVGLGAALVLVGKRFASALLLPLLFLLFAYPVPAVIANQQIYFFQIATAEFATFVVDLFRIPVIHEGDLIYARGRVFEVIETCSGLRLTETLLTSAFVYGEVMRSRFRDRIVFVLMAPILGFVLNGARVLLIMFNPLSDYSEDHTVQGIAVLVVGVLLFAVIERGLGVLFPGWPSERARRRVAAKGASDAVVGRYDPSRVAVVLVALGCVAASFSLPRWNGAGGERWQIGIPLAWEGWDGERIDHDEAFLGSVYYSRFLYRRYEKESAHVEIFAGRDDRMRRDRSVISRKNAVPGSGWKILRSRPIDVDWGPGVVEELVATQRGKHILIYHWYEGSPGFREEATRAVLGLEKSPLRLPGELRVFRVSTELRAEPGSEALAVGRVDRFARKLRESLDG
jgi:exosortase